MPRLTRYEPEIESNIAVIGIITSISSTTLVHFINTRFGFSLGRQADLPVYFEKNKTIHYFTFFDYYHADYQQNIYIVGNQCLGLKLISNFDKFDYFLIFQGAMRNESIQHLQAQIRIISGVQLASSIDPNSMKGFKNLLLDFELHQQEMMEIKTKSKNAFMPTAEMQ